MSSKKNGKLTDKLYAHAFARELQDLMLAMQIRLLREERGLSQDKLAKLSGMKQARISLLESGRYSQWSLSTLRSIAEGLDVGLDVRFSSFCTLLDRMQNETMDSLQVASRAAELSVPLISTKGDAPISVKELSHDQFMKPVVNASVDWSSASAAH